MNSTVIAVIIVFCLLVVFGVAFGVYKLCGKSGRGSRGGKGGKGGKGSNDALGTALGTALGNDALGNDALGTALSTALGSNDALSTRCKELSIRNQDLTNCNINLTNCNRELTTTLSSLRAQLQELQEQRDVYERSREINEKYQVLDGKYQVLDGKYQVLDGDYKALDGKYQELGGKYQELDRNYKVLDERCKELSGRDVSVELAELIKKRDQVKYELDHLVQVTGDIRKIMSTRGDTMIIEEKDKDMVRLIRELKSKYPCISKELSEIEWKKIWLPQLQELARKVDGKGGIYRLTLRKEVVDRDPQLRELAAKLGRSNAAKLGDGAALGTLGSNAAKLGDGAALGTLLSYYGKATKFKDRWYDHCKKMCGVEDKGGEKLYRWNPEDFEWSVVEIIDGEEMRREREKWWIDRGGVLNIR